MQSLTQTQKIILVVLAVLDVLVIGGLAAVVITSIQAPAQVAPTATIEVRNTSVLAPTWTLQPTETLRPTAPRRPTNTPTATATPLPTITATPTETPLPPAPVSLMGADFDFLLPNRIPGWKWDAYVNYKDGDDYDPETSYAEPLFTAADDPERQINGTTLKIETIRWLRFRAWVHQTVTLTAQSQVQFQIKANAFSSLDTVTVKAGIDPTGVGNCYDAQWGEEKRINQDSGTVVLRSPVVTVSANAPAPTPTADQQEEEGREADLGQEPAPETSLGRVTVCFYAEPTFPHVNNAAFFDQAELIVTPPR